MKAEMSEDHKKNSLKLEGTKTGLSRPAFTVDHTDASNLADVPSITKLLNRKTLEAKSAEPAAIKISPMKPEQIFAPSTPPTPPASKPVVRVVSSTRERRSMNRLDLWEMGRLKHSSQPHEKLVHELFDKRILHSCLFLSTAPKPPGEITPHFVAQAASGDRMSLVAWTGVRWVTSQTPLIWNSLVRSRCFSLTGTSQGALKTEEMVWRAALGVPAQMIVSIIRMGTPNQPLGILICVSQQAVTESKVEEILSAQLAGRAA